MIHEPHPYQEFVGAVMDGPAGIRCSCGVDIRIGSSYPDTSKGNESKRKVKTMKHCWDLYRMHYEGAVRRERDTAS